MKRIIIFLIIAVALSTGACAKKKKVDNVKVIMKTSKGDVHIELFADDAPVTIKNFLRYADEKLYDGTVFHRVISNFMVQGGGFLPGMTQRKTYPPIKNESRNGLNNTRGTLAMARTVHIDSATSQFFINVKDNYFLDYMDHSPKGFGYCVFGRVTKGMDVIDKIRYVKTQKKGVFQNVPVEDVVILSIKREK